MVSLSSSSVLFNCHFRFWCRVFFLPQKYQICGKNTLYDFRFIPLYLPRKSSNSVGLWWCVMPLKNFVTKVSFEVFFNNLLSNFLKGNSLLFRDTFRSEKEMWNIEDICQDIFWYLKYIFGPNFVWKGADKISIYEADGHDRRYTYYTFMLGFNRNPSG